MQRKATNHAKRNCHVGAEAHLRKMSRASSSEESLDWQARNNTEQRFA
jgi:hypothetical protein